MTGHVYFEFVPLCEDGFDVKAIYWPGKMAFEEKKDSWYTLLNWEREFRPEYMGSRDNEYIF